MNVVEQNSTVFNINHPYYHQYISPKEIEKRYHLPCQVQCEMRNSTSRLYAPDWPTPIRIGVRKLVYRESEILEWLESRRVSVVETGGDR